MTIVRVLVSAALTGLLLTACSGDDAAEGEAASGSALMVSGRIQVDPPEVEFDPTRSLDTERDLGPEPGPFELVLIGADDDELERVPFDLAAEATDEGAGRFRVAVQPPPTEPIRRMEVRRDGEPIEGVEGSSAIPSVSIESPAAGEELDPAGAEFRWTGSDEDDGSDLTYAVYLSSDGGTSWRALTAQTTATSFQPSPGVLGPSDDARLLVSVSDGVNASHAISEPFTLG